MTPTTKVCLSVDDDVFKYSISHDPIDEDGYSNRMRVQVDFYPTFNQPVILILTAWVQSTS